MLYSQPLIPEQKTRYASAMEQIEAIFALEYMAPSQHDKAIEYAILAGQISPEDAREQLLCHVLKFKTLDGFKLQAQYSSP